MRFFLLICLNFSFLGLAYTQGPPTNEEEYLKNYDRRIKKEYIFGVYIPLDLADAFTQLNRLTDKSSKAKFKVMEEELAAEKLHFSLGRWIIHNWGFYDGSRFSHYLKKLGISHPDDMARFVIVSYHRNLNRKSLNVKEQVEYYKNGRLKQAQERQKKATILFETTRPAKKKEEN